MNNRIKAYRALLKISQIDMCNKLGICISSYSQKEQGKKDFTYSELCSILNIFREAIPELTADDIFFANEVSTMITNSS